MKHVVSLVMGIAASVFAGPAIADIAGVVVDAASGSPVAGAAVTVRGGVATTTAGDGTFTVVAGDGVPVTVVAAHAGHYNAWTEATGPATGVVLQLDAVPTADDPSYAFTSPTVCASCHAEQFADWTGSPMAEAGRNTWVYDLYDGTGTAGGGGGFVYTRDSIHAATNAASECAACHQPLGWAAAPYTALAPLDPGDPAVAHGVACDLCHRVAAIDTARANFPGIWPGVVRLARPTSPVAVQFGVLGDTAFQAEPMRPAYQPQLVADVCAACHQDKNDPDQDGDFEESDGVISEPTYLEWKASSYADPASPQYATCAGCHMAPLELTSACTVQELAPRPPGQVRSHRIVGTTAEFLEQAVSASVTARVVDGEIAVDATVVNDRTGHHVPTGVTVRNVIVRLEAFGPDGAALPATGGDVIGALGGEGDPAQGYWAGLPGKLYAKIPADAAGHAPVFFSEAASLASDNRLAAGATDAIHARFALPAIAGQVEVVARVVYRRAFRLVVDAKGWTEDGHGNPLEDLAAPDFGHLMARADAAVAVSPEDLEPPDAGGCCHAGAGGAASAMGLAVLVAAAIARRGPRGRRGRAP